MISMSLDGEKQVRAAVEQFVDEAKVESTDWLKNMGYAISGTAQSRIQQRTHNRLHMYPSVRRIGDDVRLHIRFKKANAGARKIRPAGTLGRVQAYLDPMDGRAQMTTACEDCGAELDRPLAWKCRKNTPCGLARNRAAAQKYREAHPQQDRAYTRAYQAEVRAHKRAGRRIAASAVERTAVVHVGAAAIRGVAGRPTRGR